MLLNNYRTHTPSNVRMYTRRPLPHPKSTNDCFFVKPFLSLSSSHNNWNNKTVWILYKIISYRRHYSLYSSKLIVFMYTVNESISLYTQIIHRTIIIVKVCSKSVLLIWMHLVRLQGKPTIRKWYTVTIIVIGQCWIF